MLRPERKPFPIRWYNHILNTGVSTGNLNADRLIKRARKNTGLWDLGDDFNEQAIQLLVKSINEEARLNPFGRLMIREKLTGQLESRLWATHWFKQFPEILDQPVLPIVLVTGLQRTGTTKMQRILSALPQARPLLSWEALYPAPIGNSNESAKRLRRTRMNEKAIKWISPAFHSIHPIYHDRPEEDVLLLDLHFVSSTPEAIMHVPSYASWLEPQDQTEAYEYEKKLLKLLQWQRRGNFWVLKSPHHLEYLESFIKVFPETSIVWMHRSLSECIPSFLSMLYYSRCIFSDEVNLEFLKNHWIEKVSNMVKAGIDFRNTEKSPVIDVGYSRFVQDEKNVVNDIAGQLPFSIEVPEKLYREFAGEKYRSRHLYDLNDWGLDRHQLLEKFQEYEKLITGFATTRHYDEQKRKIQ